MTGAMVTLLMETVPVLMETDPVNEWCYGGDLIDGDSSWQ